MSLSANIFCASTASCSSEPVAMMITSASSAGIAAAEDVTARATPSELVPSSTGMPWRVRMKPTGPLPLPRARMLRHA